MDLVTIIGLLAASSTIISVVYFLFKKINSLITILNNRLVALEDSLKIREELVVKKEFIVKHKDNGRLYTLKEGTVVSVISLEGDNLEFITRDKLIKGKTTISNFSQLEN